MQQLCKTSYSLLRYRIFFAKYELRVPYIIFSRFYSIKIQNKELIYVFEMHLF